MLIRRKGRLAGQTATFPLPCPDIESFPVGRKAHPAPEWRQEPLDRETLDGFSGVIVNGDRRLRRQEAQSLIVLLPRRRRTYPALPTLVVGNGNQLFRASRMNRHRQRGPHLLVALRQFSAGAVGQGRGAVLSLFQRGCFFDLLVGSTRPDRLLLVGIDQVE